MSETVDEGPEERRRTISAIGARDTAQREPLLAALGDADWRVRKEAARVTAQLAEAWDLEDALVDAIAQDENVGLRNSALEVFERLGERSARPLLGALARVPDAARKFVVAALGYAGDAGATELARLTDDAEPNTAQAAIEALAKVGNATAETALRRHLGAPHAVQRLAALEGLAHMEANVTVAELRPLLDHRLLARSALRVLAFSDDPNALRVLLEALESSSGGSAAEATLAMGGMLEQDGAAARAIVEALPELAPAARAKLRSLAEVGRDGVRRAATSLLLLARDASALGPAAELASSDRLPRAALEAVRRWGSAATLPLLEAAGSLEPGAAAAALAMAADLARMEAVEDDLVDRLRAALRSALGADARTAPTIASALSEWAEIEDVPRLIETARRFPEGAGPPVAYALSRLAEDRPNELRQALLGTPIEGALGPVILPAIARLAPATAHNMLTTALNATDARTRRAAVLCLDRLEDAEQSIELAGFALADEDLDVQCAAVQVLGRYVGDPPEAGAGALDKTSTRALEQLRVALRSAADPVVAAAARALGAAHDRASMAALRMRVSEGRPGVAVAAMESLRAMGDPGLDAVLVEALGQADEELVKEALRAIAESDGSSRDARIALALSHAAWDVRQLAVELLGALGTEAARAALKERAGVESDSGVRAAIEDALDAAAPEP